MNAKGPQARAFRVLGDIGRAALSRRNFLSKLAERRLSSS
jgi:hypothetical protein